MKFFLVFLSASSFGQALFEKGYFIDNNKVRSECLIKSVDWKTNPTDFLYRLEGENEIRKGNITSAREFGIYGSSRFKSANVKIDRSQSSSEELTSDRNPVWSQEKLFLKILVESKASLYSYEDGSIEFFFYSVNDSLVHQLVHKKYLVQNSSSSDLVNINNDFRQQLFGNVRCKDTESNAFTKINYNSRDLVKYFVSYSACNGGPVAITETKTKRQLLSFKVAPGINYSSVNLVHAYYPNINFDKSIDFRFGFEIEVILTPKSRVVFEPTYEALNTQKEQTGKINYSFIDFPIGYRHYFFVGRTTKVFLNGFYVPALTLDLTSNPAINFSQVAIGWSQPTPGSIAIKHRNSFAFGVGASHNRISLEARYYTSRNITSDYLYSSSDYRRLALIFGYKIY